MTTARDIANWLENLPHVSAVEPCTLTLAGVQYPAARYRQTTTPPPGSPAALRGDEPQAREMIYIAGALPSAYLRSSHLAFRFEGDPRDWFVASYYPATKNRKQPTARPREGHPFGNSMQIAPWDAPDEIDSFEENKYRRLTARIER